jgi:hypothetical protein
VRGPRVVWLTLKPNAWGYCCLSLSISVPLPTPLGPQITSALGPVMLMARSRTELQKVRSSWLATDARKV